MKQTFTPKKNVFFQIFSLAVFFALILTLCIPASAEAAVKSGSVRYIVVFKDTVNNPTSAANGLAKAFGLQKGFVYQHAIKGMSATVPAGRLNALKKDSRVAYVVQDVQHNLIDQTVPTGINRSAAAYNPAVGINNADDLRVDVDVAVIDTGIDFQHPDLNVAGGVDCLDAVIGAACQTGGDDDHYHGTHVAGTIAALDNGDGVVGMAPSARLWAVKVLDSSGSGWSSQIIAGIDWVAANADIIEVANMSLGGTGYNQAEYDAIQGAVNAGVAFAVAAGNSHGDARDYSPSAFDNVLTVSALVDYDGQAGGTGSVTCYSDRDDTLAYFSNYGPAVDVAAPGVCITSTFPVERGGYGTISGTSMASPHVAGALALLASSFNPANAADVYYLYDVIRSTGTYDYIDDSGDGIQEPLLNVSNLDVYNPVLIPGLEADPGVLPEVGIYSPTDGSSVTNEYPLEFTGWAADAEDGDLTDSMVWSSSIDGELGWGGLVSFPLSVGTHTIQVTVSDSAGGTAQQSITVVVTNVVDPLAVGVSELTGAGVKVNKKTWKATVTVQLDQPLSGAVVSGLWSNGKTFTCTTNTQGACSAALTLQNKVTSIGASVTDVILTGYAFTPSEASVTISKP